MPVSGCPDTGHDSAFLSVFLRRGAGDGRGKSDVHVQDLFASQFGDWPTSGITAVTHTETANWLALPTCVSYDKLKGSQNPSLWLFVSFQLN